MKSKSTGSKSDKSLAAKKKSVASKSKAGARVVRLSTKSSQKSGKTSTSGGKKSPAKLKAVEGTKVPKQSQQVESMVARKVVATKNSSVKASAGTGGKKKGEVVRFKSQGTALSLVSKDSVQSSVARKTMPKISRSEPSGETKKLVNGQFSIDAYAPTHSARDKGEDGVGRVVATTTSASAIAFKSGDKIVYPGHGVGEVEGIRTTVLGGQEHHIYNIKILDSGMKVMVPVSQASAVGLRKIIDKKAIEEVFSILKDRDFKIDTQTWNRRFREYSQKIKTGSVFEIAIVLRDLLVLSADKELSFGEKKMLDMAESLLVSEIALAKARPHEKIVGELRALFV